MWAAVNPNEVKQARHQQSFLFLQNDLPNLLEDVPLRQHQQMWFMHDDAPAHFHPSVRRSLNRRYGEWWIGRGEPVPWPP